MDLLIKLPKSIVLRILLYLKNPEVDILKTYEGYGGKYPMYTYLNFDRSYLPSDWWYLYIPYYNLENFSYYEKKNYMTYYEYEDIWEATDFSTDEESLDSI